MVLPASAAFTTSSVATLTPEIIGAGGVSSTMVPVPGSLSFPAASVAVADTPSSTSKVSGAIGVIVNSPVTGSAITVFSGPLPTVIVTVEPGSAVPVTSVPFAVVIIGAGSTMFVSFPLSPSDAAMIPAKIPLAIPATATDERPPTAAELEPKIRVGAASTDAGLTTPAPSIPARSTNAIELSSLKNKRFFLPSWFSSKNPLIRATSPLSSSRVKSFPMRSIETTSDRSRFNDTSEAVELVRSTDDTFVSRASVC